jgi:TetR/AcrR family transcriptional regulator, fatty acid metabolism regulator protein
MRTKSGNKEKCILDAAVTIFARDGYHKAKISSIADLAGVSIGSVYVYFENKENILNRLFTDLWSQFSRQLQATQQNKQINAMAKIDAMIDLVFDGFINNADLALVFVNEQNWLLQRGTAGFAEFYEKYLQLGTRIVQEGMKEGLFRKDLDLLVVRHFTFGGIRHLVHLWARDPVQFSLAQFRSGIKDLICNSIRAK